METTRHWITIDAAVLQRREGLWHYTMALRGGLTAFVVKHRITSKTFCSSGDNLLAGIEDSQA